MTLRVSAGNINDKTVAIINIINEKIKKILSVCVLLKIVFFIIIVVYYKYIHFQIFFIWNFLYTQSSDFFHKCFFICILTMFFKFLEFHLLITKQYLNLLLSLSIVPAKVFFVVKTAN